MQKNKLKNSVVFGLALCSVFAFTNIYAQEPTNLQDTKDAVVSYHDSGEYNKDVKKVVDEAISYLHSQIDHKNSTNNAKLAVVFDIDDTCLSGYNRFKDLGFGGNIDLWHAGEMQAEDPAIPEVLHLYQEAQKAGVKVFFITGRYQKEQPATEANLKKVGYKSWGKIYFKPENFKQIYKGNVDYKSTIRKQIEEQGYKIVVNIGDQNSDLLGGHAEKTFKLPNPLYRIS